MNSDLPFGGVMGAASDNHLTVSHVTFREEGSITFG